MQHPARTEFPRSRTALIAGCLANRAQLAGLLLLVLLSTQLICANAAEQSVKLTDQVQVRVPGPWRLVETHIRNMAQLELPASADPRGAVALRVILSTEMRENHLIALQRVREVEAERGGKVRFLTIAGWPAIERVSVIELPRIAGGDELDKSWGPPVHATVVTVAVCVGATVVRYEGTVQPGSSQCRSGRCIEAGGRATVGNRAGPSAN
jgi:hypothetical protein